MTAAAPSFLDPSCLRASSTGATVQRVCSPFSAAAGPFAANAIVASLTSSNIYAIFGSVPDP
jgi:hypothetical protein